MAILAGGKVDASEFAFKTWTPVFTGVTLGTASALFGWYTNVNGMVNAGFQLVFGTSPAFTSSVIVDLPVTANTITLQAAFGSWVLRDTSTTMHYAGTVAGWDAGGTQISFSGALNTTTNLPNGRLGSANIIGSSGAPGVSATDVLSAQITYRAA